MGPQISREQEQLKNLNCKISVLRQLKSMSTGFAFEPIIFFNTHTIFLPDLVSEKELQKLYKNFSKIDKDKSGTLEPQEFFDIPGRNLSLF